MKKLMIICLIVCAVSLFVGGCSFHAETSMGAGRFGNEAATDMAAGEPSDGRRTKTEVNFTKEDFIKKESLVTSDNSSNNNRDARD